MEYSVRRAIIEDTSSLAHIIVESWRSAYSNLLPKDEIQRYLNVEIRKNQFEKYISQEEIVLIGYINDRPCGLVFASPENDEGVDRCGSIYSMYTIEEAWGKGLGKSLMDEVMIILKDEGCKRVLLWVYEENPRARKFYEKCGFKFDGTSKESHFSNNPIELRYQREI